MFHVRLRHRVVLLRSEGKRTLLYGEGGHAFIVLNGPAISSQLKRPAPVWTFRITQCTLLYTTRFRHYRNNYSPVKVSLSGAATSRTRVEGQTRSGGGYCTVQRLFIANVKRYFSDGNKVTGAPPKAIVEYFLRK